MFLDFIRDLIVKPQQIPTILHLFHFCFIIIHILLIPSPLPEHPFIFPGLLELTTGSDESHVWFISVRLIFLFHVHEQRIH